jgi:hypothetical protein
MPPSVEANLPRSAQGMYTRSRPRSINMDNWIGLGVLILPSPDLALIRPTSTRIV